RPAVPDEAGDQQQDGPAERAQQHVEGLRKDEEQRFTSLQGRTAVPPAEPRAARKKTALRRTPTPRASIRSAARAASEWRTGPEVRRWACRARRRGGPRTAGASRRAPASSRARSARTDDGDGR